MAALTFKVATRRSPLALKQTELVIRHLKKHEPSWEFTIIPMVTTGDRQMEWSLQEKGGKGLFTKELEEALLRHEVDLAVHSAKDLPTDLQEGLNLAGFLPRADARDVLVRHIDALELRTIASSSPRRIHQLKQSFPQANWISIRGNVETRLRKIAKGEACATVLAAAGLERLGIGSYPGLIFEYLPFESCVPAVGQGAIALECPSSKTHFWEPYLCAETKAAVDFERAFLERLGGGCQVAYAAHKVHTGCFVFHEKVGMRFFKNDFLGGLSVEAILQEMGR